MLGSLIATILSGEAVEAARRARTTAIAYAAAGLLGFVGVGFLVGAGFVAAARRFGTIEAALAFGFGFLVVGLGIVAIHSMTEKRKKKAAASRRTADIATIAGVAAVTLLPTLLRGRSAVGGIAAAALGILAYGIYRENTRPKDGDPPAE